MTTISRIRDLQCPQLSLESMNEFLRIVFFLIELCPAGCVHWTSEMLWLGDYINENVQRTYFALDVTYFCFNFGFISFRHLISFPYRERSFQVLESVRWLVRKKKSTKYRFTTIIFVYLIKARIFWVVFLSFE